MAFSDLLDWSTIAIVLHFTKIDRLPKLVNRTNVEVRVQEPGQSRGHDGVLTLCTLIFTMKVTLPAPFTSSLLDSVSWGPNFCALHCGLDIRMTCRKCGPTSRRHGTCGRTSTPSATSRAASPTRAATRA